MEIGVHLLGNASSTLNFLNPFSSCAFAGVAVNIKMAANVVIKPTFFINISNIRCKITIIRAKMSIFANKFAKTGCTSA